MLVQTNPLLLTHHATLPASNHSINHAIMIFPDKNISEKVHKIVVLQSTASPSENWRRPPGRPRTTWMKTIQQDLRSNNFSLDEAIIVAQNRPLWRLMSAFGATHS